MQTKNQKHYYSPQFSPLAAISVRRLAWAINKPMPAAVDIMVKLMPLVVDPKKVCSACTDKTKCQCCCFMNPPKPEEMEILEAVT